MDWPTLDEMIDKYKSEGSIPFLGPTEAYWVLHNQSERSFSLVDVRTTGELSMTGTPKGGLHVVWSVDGKENPGFIKELSKLVPSKSENIIFMCRSGGRSASAAAAAASAGYVNVYNLKGGYNGISVSVPEWIEDWE